MKRILLLLPSFLLGFSLVAQVPNNVPTAGLQTWYGFNANGNDGSGNGNTLTNYGSTYGTDRTGALASAGLFNGNPQYQAVTSPSFTFGETGTFSVSFWFLKSSPTYGVLLMSGSPSGGPFVWNFQTSNTGQIQFGTNRQGQAWTWAQTIFNTNTWTHVVGTYNQGLMTLFINGVQVTSNVYPHTGALQGTHPLYIARGVSGNYSQASIDDVGIWNRVLTAGEILALYQGCGAQVNGQPNGITARTGGSAQFSVTTTGTTNLSYAWEQNSGAGWTAITNGGQFVGANTSMLSVNNLILANNNLQFRCLVSQSASCADTSNPATLNVCGEILTTTADTNVTINGMARFEVQTTDPAATFQWQEDAGSGFVNLTNNATYSGVTTAVLQVSNLTMSQDQNRYRVIVGSNTCTDTTNPATLTVVNNIGLDDQTAHFVRLYPNPAVDELMLEGANVQNNAVFTIYNLQGVAVMKGRLENGRTSISGLAQGAYFFQIENFPALSFVKI